MNYEKAYKEALEKARKLATDLPNGRADRLYHVSDLEVIFPELKESEDDRIRKMLIKIFKKADMGGEIFGEGITYKQVIAWLEKQGIQKAVEYSLEQAAEIFLDSLAKTPYNNKPVTDAQVITKELLKFLFDTNSYNPNAINEQKPTWSEEDELMIQDAIHWIQEFQKSDRCKDENDMQNSVTCENWLKSIKPNHWKPSEEEMNDLYYAAKQLSVTRPSLKTLYEHLKTL